MKNKVFEVLKRLYPNATGFRCYKTSYGTFYFTDNDGVKEDITDTFKKICFTVACDILSDKLNETCIDYV